MTDRFLGTLGGGGGGDGFLTGIGLTYGRAIRLFSTTMHASTRTSSGTGICLICLSKTASTRLPIAVIG